MEEEGGGRDGGGGMKGRLVGDVYTSCSFVFSAPLHQ